jgi:hypothetical protein
LYPSMMIIIINSTNIICYIAKVDNFLHIYPCAFDCRIPNFTKEATKMITH